MDRDLISKHLVNAVGPCVELWLCIVVGCSNKGAEAADAAAGCVIKLLRVGMIHKEVVIMYTFYLHGFESMLVFTHTPGPSNSQQVFYD